MIVLWFSFDQLAKGANGSICCFALLEVEFNIPLSKQQTTSILAYMDLAAAHFVNTSSTNKW